MKQDDTLMDKVTEYPIIIEKAFSLACDKCTDIDGDYFITTFPDGEQLRLDKKKGIFACLRNHEVTFKEASRDLRRISPARYFSVSFTEITTDSNNEKGGGKNGSNYKRKVG